MCVCTCVCRMLVVMTMAVMPRTQSAVQRRRLPAPAAPAARTVPALSRKPHSPVAPRKVAQAPRAPGRSRRAAAPLPWHRPVPPQARLLAQPQAHQQRHQAAKGSVSVSRLHPSLGRPRPQGQESTGLQTRKVAVPQGLVGVWRLLGLCPRRRSRGLRTMVVSSTVEVVGDGVAGDQGVVVGAEAAARHHRDKTE